MPSLTIGGQTWDLALTARDLVQAERRIMREGGRPLLATLTTRDAGLFAVYELEAIVWAAWKGRVSDARVLALLEQFYTEGGTLFELHQQVVEAILESGLVGRRAPPNGAGPPGDPPGAGVSA